MGDSDAFLQAGVDGDYPLADTFRIFMMETYPTGLFMMETYPTG